MSDPAGEGAAPAATATCQWCSATVPADATTCPSCGASLQSAADGEILGVTQVDPGAISRAARGRPGRLAKLLGAEVPIESELGGRIEPPTPEVLEEMRRLELAAIDAEMAARASQAEAERTLAAETAPEAASEADPS